MGSNAQRRREQRESKVAQLRKEETARQRRSTVLLSIGLVVVVALGIGGVWWAVAAGSSDDPTSDALADVKTYDYKGSQHTDKKVDYTESPPVGGEHNPLWLACGVYDKPVEKERAVHSLEHGAVWVTYDPTLPQADIDELKSRLTGSYLLVSPYPGLDAPVVATAWNNQLRMDGVDDPRLDAFITQFRQGPQTPEPGASCDDPGA